jgi:hypothetical protein
VKVSKSVMYDMIKSRNSGCDSRSKVVRSARSFKDNIDCPSIFFSMSFLAKSLDLYEVRAGKLPNGRAGF